MNKNKSIALMAFYNTKALGVRYLETAMKKAGYSVKTIFFKGFNSQNPKVATDEEIELNNVYQMSGNKISVKTLDLNCDFEVIKKQLSTVINSIL